MKAVILVMMAVLAMSVNCQTVQQSQYDWVSDMVRLWIDFVLLAITNPIYGIISFFFNNQEAYYTHVNKFMNTKGFRLSYTYM